MDLFENNLIDNTPVPLADGAVLLRGFVKQAQILADLAAILAVSPLRNMITPGGFTMSVAMTNCGDLGWITDRKGYRYASLDPITNQPWQAMPPSFLALASAAAAQAGFANFATDACLINQYKTGARMTLHQDKDEQDFKQPIVSVSLGCTATFQFGALARSDKPIKILLNHGDVLVFGGASRLCYHGILPLKSGMHALLGARRMNMTFRKAA